MATQGISRRKGTTDHGSSYEQKVAAFLAVKCALSDDVRDMWMATNVDKLGAFDDLVLSIERNNGTCIRKEMYLIQIKHSNNKPISLTSGTNDLKKYQESFLKIQQDFDNDSSPLKNSCDFQNIKFLLFTNTQINMNQTNNITLSAYQNTDFINTGKILQISHNSQSMYDQSFLKQMFFYTKQVGVSKIGNVLKNEVDNYFNNCDGQQIIKFFEDWHSEYFENKIVLKKEDIQSVILQTVLSHYIPEPIVTDFPNAAMWNEVVSQLEFVFIQDGCQLAKIWQAVNLQICNFLDDQSLNIKKWKERLQEPTNKINKIKQHLQRQEVLIRKDKSSYSIRDLYLLLWQFCEIPLILNLKINDSQEDIRTALVKLNSPRGIKRRYIFLGKISDHFLQGYTLFNVLSVDKDLKKKLLKNTCLSLQNRKAVTLEKLNISNAALEKISPDVLIELLQSATEKTEINREYITRFIRQPTVSINVLSIPEAVFVIVTEGTVPKGHILFDRFFPHMSWSIYKLFSKEFSEKLIINDSNKFVRCIILNNRIKDLKEFVYIENIIKEIREDSEQTVHYFRLLNKNELIWLHSNKNVNQIKPFITSNSEEYLSDSELFHYLSFNILSGNAGEGKSVLLEFIANDCPAEVWVIKLNIREIIAYIEEDNFSTIKTFLYDQSKNFNKHNEFYWELFQHLYEERNMLVIIDGVDEAAYNSKIERFLDAIKSLGIKTIIAARPTLRDSLEKQFHMSLFLKPFTVEDCRSLINLTLQNNYEDIDETFVNGFLKKMFSWNNILGVPLLLKLYVSLLSNGDATDINKLDISDLFDRYINEQLKKVESCNTSTMRTLSRSALSVFYNKNALSELFIIKEYLEDMEDKTQIYVKSKLIEKLNNNNVPVFAHKSLAEFLTAKYLSNLVKDNANNIPDNFLKSLFYKELEMVRFFFDIILLKDSGLQDIITCNNHSHICDKINDSVDKFGRNSMYIAASYGNRSELRITQLLWSGVNIYESYNDIICENIIHPCQEFERKPIVPVDIVEKFLQKGLDPFKKDNLFKMDVFDFAIESGSLEVIEVLFSKNFIKPLENINHDILLYVAVKNGYINIFRQLRSKNFNLKILPAGDSLLHVALSTENLEIIKELTDSIIPIDELNILGYSPLISWLFSLKFISSGRIKELNNIQLEILYHLIDKNVNLNIVNRLGETPLHAFCCSQTASIVEKLIQNGAEVNKKTILGNIPLHFASTFSLEIVKLLINNKSNIDIPNNLGHTPLCFAARTNKPDILKYLIKKGSNVNRPKNLASPLNDAILNGHVNCAELLIKRNAKINNNNVNNTLALAVSFGHLNCVKLLINYEAKIFKGLLDLAILHHHIDVIKFLFNEDKVPNDIKNETTKSFFSKPVEFYYDIDIIDTLIPFGLDINAKLKNGNTALHLASILGLVNITEYLIKRGSNVNVENDNGITPLTLAAQFNNLEIIKIYINNGSDLQKYGPDTIFEAARKGYDAILDYLISTGTDINKTNSRGYAPIHCASETHLNCVRKLTERGADVNLKALDSAVTPLMLAASNGFKEILEYLVENDAKLDESNKNRQTALIAASQEGHLECVQFLIGKGSDVNSHGSTAILCALLGDHIAVADYLISVGADINGIITTGVCAPIHQAVFENNLKAVKYLLTKGADINSKSIDNDSTPLIIAAFKGSQEILEYLVENDAKLDEPNKNRNTALIAASQEGHLECVQFLIGKGSDVNSHGSTAILDALLGDHIAVADYLISVGADINGIITTGVYAPIHEAVLKNNLKAVKYLLTKGADINSKSIDNDSTPLIVAALKGSKEILEYLVENDAKLDESNKNRQTALIAASQEGHLECVQFLIGKGSDVNSHGSTAILFALLRDHIAVADYLISVGADINGIITTGVCAPIHQAVFENNLKAVKYLLTKGADINSKSIDNDSTPLIVAALKGSKQILEYLVENDAKLDEPNKNRNTALIAASKEGHLECVQFLIDKGSNVNSHGSTAILFALLRDHIAVADYLISVGADINGIITTGVCAPIHQAVFENNLKAVKYLLTKGADINSKSIDNDNTPLIIAAFKGSKEILEYLVENDAKLDEPSKNRHTALIVASQEGHLECVQILINKGSDIHKYGLFAIYFAALRKHTCVVNFLISVAYGSSQ